eukprot:CAMPEP_0183334546 /NCGR_PEP_ID=MMETSP0164_2-20130417/3123_1 /TAXON_ID=221442 /ORGANISM="Coccolithus pelagicus ssp braarudi, Strain PLY182g" /LENGTH=205 /DNA_ID=CAMNT_0025503713 /DNA_START=122 /DNA_END=739 /DNA_ORIENTATION=+
MPTASGYTPLERELSEHELLQAVETAVACDHTGVCFAGLGEPLLRLGALEACARQLRISRPQMQLRVTTNGLVSRQSANEVARRLVAAGVSRASVALASADPKQWTSLVAPLHFVDETEPRPAQGGITRGDVQQGGVKQADQQQGGIASTSLPALDDVCAFVSALVGFGCDVELTIVAAPGVNLDAAAALASQLGASFRQRDYHG